MSTTNEGMDKIEIKKEPEDKKVEAKEEKPEAKYFECEICSLREKYEYFGNDPPFVKQFKLEENAYVIEDPFLPPKQGEIIILGSHCVKCGKSACKDNNCSFYFDGTYCIFCAKTNQNSFPKSVKDKLDRIILS